MNSVNFIKKADQLLGSLLYSAPGGISSQAHDPGGEEI